MLHSMIRNPQQWFYIAECLLTKKIWWRCLLLVLKMHRTVDEWCHHAQAIWCSAYGFQCVWFSLFEYNHCRFKWSYDCHNVTIVEKSDSKPHSPSNPCNHKHWVVAFTTPLYSASIDERAMALYFLLDQLISTFACMNTYPDLYFWSVLSPSQSLSVNPIKSRSDLTL